MPAPQGYVTYPGVVAVISGTYTLAHGITPGLIQLEIAPQSTPVSPTGNVVFYYGAGTLTLTDCKADMASTLRGSGGTITSLTIQDRRWRWRFGEIYGHYNQRDADGKVIAGTEKTNQQLAVLLLNAMGETADVSAIPNSDNDTEETEWVGHNPAEELQSLCEAHGCSIVLRADQSIGIVRLGTGGLLPLDYLTQAQVDSNPPDVPAKIRVVCAPHLFQARLKLEAVAEDTDGKIKKVNDLSYKPAGVHGWGRSFWTFPEISPADPALKLALRDVWKLYRINIENVVLSLPDGAGSVTKNRQILPLHRGLVVTDKGQTGGQERLPERVYGIYFIGNTGNPENSTYTSNFDYKGSFSIDHEKGMVRFSQPVVKYYSSLKTWIEPELWLECAFSLRDINTGAMFRYVYDVATGFATGAGTDVVRREDLFSEFYEKYNSNSAPAVWYQKDPKPTEPAQAAAISRKNSYVSEYGASANYAGLVAISPDGTILQVTWNVGPGGATTSASRNAEVSVNVPPRRKLREVERQRAFKQQQLDKQIRNHQAVIDGQRRRRSRR